jgi:hypothetical protein
MAIQIQLRRDTAAHWTSINPTLAEGEFGIETDTNTFKIGDGINVWVALPYMSGVFSEIRLVPKTSSAGAEGTIYYDSDDNYLYVATE